MTTATGLTISKYGAEMSIEKVTLDKASVNLYSVAADSKTKENAFDEYEIVLSEKPKTNIFTLPFTSKDLVFYYQPPLTQELDPKEYDSITETEAIKDGKIAVYRPENIVGSYAVYHASKSGGVYGTGQVFHIYRPWSEDAKGVRVWCDLKIQDNSLIITVPQDFLDKAVYPIIIDPTLGYTTKGGSSYNTGANYLYMTKYTCSGNGNISALKMYVKQYTTTTPNVKFCIYNDAGDGTPGALAGVTVQWTVTAGWDDWKELEIDGADIAVTDGTIYYLGFLCDGIVTYYANALSSGAIFAYTNAATYPTFPDPTTVNPSLDRAISIYAIFAAASTGQQLFCLLNEMGY